MEVARTIGEVREKISAARRRGLSVGFVPTMGALHEGHLSLMRRAREETGYVVISIFVNPTQFAPNEDFDKYPRQFESDKELAEKEGVDLIFYPDVEEMYPDGFVTKVVQEKLTEVWEGASRPTHFTGVLTVVAKLFNIVQPDKAYFGQKDFQQSVVVRRMVRDLNMPLEIVVCPTVREPDGLAMSSRNSYLSPEERKDALCLFKALSEAKRLFDSGERDADRIRREMRRIIESHDRAQLDYATIVDAETLSEVETVKSGDVAIVAARVGSTRLIDNMVL